MQAADLVVDQQFAARRQLVDAIRSQRDRQPADRVPLGRLRETHRERRTQLLQREQPQYLPHGALDFESREPVSIANVARQRLRGMSLRAVANLAFESAVLDREQLFLRPKRCPELGEHSMQQRSAVDGLYAETDSRHRLGAQPDLRLRPERAARLQLHRARTATRIARRQRAERDRLVSCAMSAAARRARDAAMSQAQAAAQARSLPRSDPAAGCVRDARRRRAAANSA